jgi:hypothetical protein
MQMNPLFPSHPYFSAIILDVARALDFDPNLPAKEIFHQISEASPLGLAPKLV